MRGKTNKPFKPVYALEDSATGLYLNLDGEAPRLTPFGEASQFPATHEGRLSAYTAMHGAGAYELVRRDA